MMIERCEDDITLWGNGMKQAMEAGNIERSTWPHSFEEHVNVYMGSGRCGSGFDAYGLMNKRGRGSSSGGIGNTMLMHRDHYHRGYCGLDYYLPVARLGWNDEPPPGAPGRYSQSLALYDNRLTTEMQWSDLLLRTTSAFHPDLKDVLATEIDYVSSRAGAMPALRLSAETNLQVHYGQTLTGALRHDSIRQAEGGFWQGQLRAGTAAVTIMLKIVSERGEAVLAAGEHGTSIRFEGAEGKHLLLIGVCDPARAGELAAALEGVRSAEEYMEQASRAWHRRWGDSWIRIPDERLQAMWARSLYYALCSFEPEAIAPSPVNGWSGNGWPFHFPQDFAFVLPALLRLGHCDIGKAWIECYASHLPAMEAYTREVYGAQGTMWAWVFPIGPDSDLLREGAPNKFHYEIHNPAHVVRMAWETSCVLNDPEWSRRVAWPVVQGAAKFFASVAKRSEQGVWDIHVVPSMGQDEYGGENAPNYLCALYAALYTLRTALDMADALTIREAEAAQWRVILEEGLAFPKLLDVDRGLYRTCGNQSEIGGQKHPVQLLPLTALPLNTLDDAVRNAYEQREELCGGSSQRRYYGWTLASFWLAASHIGDADGLLKELGHIAPGHYADSDGIQFYESSGAVHMPFYVTTHGYFLQALNDALVSDYWGDVRFGTACPEQWHGAAFHRLHMRNGEIVSGRKERDGWVCSVEECSHD